MSNLVTLPQDSYVAKWVRATANYFPNDGERVTVYITDLNYSTDLSKLHQFVQLLNNEPNVVSSVNSWIPNYEKYMNEFYEVCHYVTGFLCV